MTESKTKKPMSIKVLGKGCHRCAELTENTKQAVQALGRDEEVQHITDPEVLKGYSLPATPALVLDEQVVSYGKVLTKEEVMAYLNPEK